MSRQSRARPSLQWVRRQAVLWAAFTMSCAGTDPTPVAQGVVAKTLADASVEQPDGTAVPAAEGCREVLTLASGDVSFTRKTWDAAHRVLVAESSSSSDFSGKVSTLRWRYGSQGQILAYVGQGVERPFQHDYSYDEHENRVDFRLTNPGIPDLDVKSEARVWIGTSYANEYDANGRLVASIATSYGDASNEPSPPVRTVYEEDASGRCAHIEATLPKGTMVEDREYDVAGRLTHVEVVTDGRERVRDIDYDHQGRVVLSTVTFSGDGAYDPGSFVQKHDYLADGSERVDITDGTTDVRGAEHRVQTRTAACLAIDAEIGTWADTRCRRE